MPDIYTLRRGNSPLIVSIPHAGRWIPPDMAARMTDVGRAQPDTDFHLGLLYGFAQDMDATIVTAQYSRYVIDLNRPPDDETLYAGQVKTGLVPLETFAGESIYLPDRKPDPTETADRRARYWQPYHDCITAEIARLRGLHGCVFLYDAHSIKSVVPRLFDGVLPDLNVGTAQGASCDVAVADRVMDVLADTGYTSVLNGRFVGGYITRHYGCSDRNVHALQMEIACKAYMSETAPDDYNPAQAEKLQGVLKKVLSAMTGHAKICTSPPAMTP